MNKSDGYERNLREGQRKIRLLAESLNLNHADVKNLAYEYLKKIEDSKKLKGKSLETKVGAVVFYAARNCGKDKKAGEILEYVASSQSELGSCFKKCKELDIIKFTPLAPSKIVDQVSNKLELNFELKRAGKITADNFGKNAICEGRRPQTIAAVSLMMVLEHFKKDKSDLLDKISKEVHIGSGTITETYR